MTKPYNPCDEKPEDRPRAKRWEILRRNRNFRRYIDLHSTGIHRITFDPAAQLQWDDFLYRNFEMLAMYRAVKDPSFRDKQFNCALPPKIYERNWSDLPLEHRSPYSSIGEMLQNRDSPMLVEDQTSIEDTRPDEIFTIPRTLSTILDTSNFHHVLVPKEVGCPHDREEALEELAKLISIRNKSANAALFGSDKQWVTFLKVEQYLTLEGKEGDFDSTEIEKEAIRETILSLEGDEDGIIARWFTIYQERYLKINRLIEKAFPSPSELE